MLNTSFILLLILGLIAWFWFDTQRSQEMAFRVCKRACRQLNLLLLDDTIAVVRIRLKRIHGQLKVQRTYQFEFYNGNNKRLQGAMILSGITLEMLEMPGYIDRIINL